MDNYEGEKFGEHSDEEKVKDEALNKELSDMLKNVELDEGTAFNKEQEAADTKVMSIEGRTEINKEIEFLDQSISFSKDLIDHGGDYRWMPLRSIVEELTDKNKVDELIDTSPPGTRFHKMPSPLVSAFATGMKLWIKKGVLRGDMQLADAIKALERKREDDQELLGWSDMLIKRKVLQDQLERNRTKLESDRAKLERTCEAISIAITDNVRTYEVTRKKSSLFGKFSFKDVTDAGTFAQSIPLSMMQKGNEVSFLVQFDEKLLDEAQKRFSWMR